MPYKAFQRFFLLVFPLSLLLLALFLSQNRDPKNLSSPKHSNKSPVKAPNLCELRLALSFFPQSQGGPLPAKASQSGAGQAGSYLLSQKYFQDQVSAWSHPKKPIFVLPLVLNREENWLISNKVFFVSDEGERKELSQLSDKEIQEQNKAFKVLFWEQALTIAGPSSSFLLKILGSDREKILKNLNKILHPLKGELFLSSPNEKLLKDLQFLRSQPLKPAQKRMKNFKIIHSFKALMHSQLLSAFPRLGRQKLWGDGVWIPSPISKEIFDSLKGLKQQNKSLFVEKEPPDNKEDLSDYIFISSKPGFRQCMQ